MAINVEEIIKEADLVAIASQDTYLRKCGKFIYSGPCPFCGGRDRFVIVMRKGRWVWYCRGCGENRYHDVIDYIIRRERLGFYDACLYLAKIGPGTADDDKIVIRNDWKVNIKRLTLERQMEIDRRLADFTTQEIWEAYQRRLTAEHRQWWRDQGIPDEWQNYLKLGYTPNKGYHDKEGQLVYAPAYTIPYFHFDPDNTPKRKFVTMQYRFLGIEGSGKYRFEHGLGSSYYHSTPTMPIGDNVIITEGAKKAIVTRLNIGPDITVLAIPSKNDGGGVLDAINHCKRVWVILDPDAYREAYNIAEKIGDKARVVELPTKIDDAFISHGLNKDRFINYLKQGVKVDKKSTK